jgi:surface antigen
LGKRPLFVRENSLIAGDLMVLAITALEVAVTEKDIANAMDPADRRFLTMMRNNGTDIESCIGAAEAKTASRPIDTALPGTDAAVLHGQGRGEMQVQGRFLAEAAEGERLFLRVFMELAIA